MFDSPSEIDALGYRVMIRVGVERGLIKSDVRWFGYRELRNITSHVYNPAKARKVFGALRRFLVGTKDLHARLNKAGKYRGRRRVRSATFNSPCCWRRTPRREICNGHWCQTKKLQPEIITEPNFGK